MTQPKDNRPSSDKRSFPNDTIDQFVADCALFCRPDNSFETPNGASVVMLCGGETIFHRWDELDVANRAWVDSLAGALVINDKPIYFQSLDALEDAFEKLQEALGVKKQNSE